MTSRVQISPVPAEGRAVSGQQLTLKASAHRKTTNRELRSGTDARRQALKLVQLIPRLARPSGRVQHATGEVTPPVRDLAHQRLSNAAAGRGYKRARPQRSVCYTTPEPPPLPRAHHGEALAGGHQPKGRQADVSPPSSPPQDPDRCRSGRPQRTDVPAADEGSPQARH